jgi:hypothetical protein
MTIKKIILSSEEVKESGEAVLTGSGTFVVPNGVDSISILLIEGGNPGSTGGNFVIGTGGVGGQGGLGGRIRYLNNYPVTPGQSFTYAISSGAANFGSILTGAAGGVDAGRAGQGGTGGGAASGQTTKSAGGYPGGPASIFEAGTVYDFLTTNYGSGAGNAGLRPGGGGGGGASGANLQGSTDGSVGGAGGAGVIYVLWSGSQREFPSTRTPYEAGGSIVFDPRGLPTDAGKFATNGSGTWIGINLTNNAGLRGTVYRSTDNAQSFVNTGVARDAQFSGIAYAAGAFLIMLAASIVVGGTSVNAALRSTDNGQSWELITFAIGSFNGPADLTSFGDRFFMNSMSTGSSDNNFAYSDNAGTSWTYRREGSAGAAPDRATSIVRAISSTVVLTRRNPVTSGSYLTKDLTNFTSELMSDIAKAAGYSYSITTLSGGRLNYSTNDLTSSTSIAGLTLAATLQNSFLVPLSDRVLAVAASQIYQAVGPSGSFVAPFPIEFAVGSGSPIISPGFKVAADGFGKAIISLNIGGKSINYRVSAYAV